MRGNPGRMYETEDGKIIIAFNKDQQQEFYNQGKIMVEELVPGNTLFPEMNAEKGTVKKVLKSRKGLKLIGFVD